MSKLRPPKPSTPKPTVAPIKVKTSADTLSETKRWVMTAADEKAVLRGCRFDGERAEFVCNWIESYCVLYEGSKAGEPFTLLPFQRQYLSRLFGWVTYSQDWNQWVRRFTHGSFWAAKKNGKPIDIETLIPTTVGLVRMGDITTSHKVFDDQGRPTRVVATSEVMTGKKCYRLKFGGDVEITAAADHVWQVECISRKRDETRGKWVSVEKTTQEIADSLLIGGRPRYRVIVPPPTETPDITLPMDPYCVGFWLGNGKRTRGDFTIRTCDVPYVLPSLTNGMGEPSSDWDNPGESRHYYFTGAITVLKSLGLGEDKFIPEIYFQAGTQQRWELLQGLMDSDGCISKDKNQCIYSTSDVELRDSVLRLLSSLGYKATWNAVEATENNTQTITNYRVLFTAEKGDKISRLPRKINNLQTRKEKTRADHRPILACDPCDSVPVRCIQVAATSHLFLITDKFVPTHNSPLAAAVNLYLLAGDGEAGQKVYQAAKNGDQAKIAQKHAVEMVRQSPHLSEVCRVNNTTLAINHIPSSSVLMVLTGDDTRGAKSKEGLNGSVTFDEMHVVDREMYERTSRAGISRKEPFILSYSTAGDDPSSIGYERCMYGRQVNEGTRDDITFLHVEYTTDPNLTEADIEADIESFGRAANPAWGHIVKPGEFRSDWERSKGSTREVARFLQYRGNRWIGSTNRWLDVRGWNKGAQTYTLAELAGRECYAAIDLSRTRDMTAFVLTFPNEDESVYLWPVFWMPEQTAKERDHLFPFMTWARDGHLTLTNGGVVDYARVKRDIRALVAEHDIRIQKLFFDSHYAEEITQQLCDGEALGSESVDGIGAERVSFPQTVMSFTGPAKEFERRVSAGLVLHPSNPVLSWMVGHCETWSDGNNNIKPVKPKPNSGKSIDGVVSAVMSFAELLVSEESYVSPDIWTVTL